MSSCNPKETGWASDEAWSRSSDNVTKLSVSLCLSVLQPRVSFILRGLSGRSGFYSYAVIGPSEISISHPYPALSRGGLRVFSSKAREHPSLKGGETPIPPRSHGWEWETVFSLRTFQCCFQDRGGPFLAAHNLCCCSRWVLSNAEQPWPFPPLF